MVGVVSGKDGMACAVQIAAEVEQERAVRHQLDREYHG
jgi:hypothetical protein